MATRKLPQKTMLYWQQSATDEVPYLTAVRKADEIDLDEGAVMVGIYQLVRTVRVSAQPPKVEPAIEK